MRHLTLNECPDAMTPEEARMVLGIGRNKMYSYLNEGRIRSIKNGKRYIIPKEAIVDFLAGKDYNNSHQHKASETVGKEG